MNSIDRATISTVFSEAVKNGYDHFWLIDVTSLERVANGTLNIAVPRNQISQRAFAMSWIFSTL